jgi:hypothetical protein
MARQGKGASVMLIHKVSRPAARGVHTFQVPHGSKILSVGNQKETLSIWYMFDEGVLDLEKMTVRFFTTGDAFTLKPKDKFIGTVSFSQGELILHVFQGD